MEVPNLEKITGLNEKNVVVIFSVNILSSGALDFMNELEGFKHWEIIGTNNLVDYEPILTTKENHDPKEIKENSTFAVEEEVLNVKMKPLSNNESCLKSD